MGARRPLCEQDTDESLMRRVAAGDRDALGELFDRYRLAIYALCARIARDADDADDLVQEVFLRVLRFRDSYRADAAFRTWLYRIAVNVSMDHERRRRASRELQSDALLRAAPASEPASSSDLAVEVAAALATLPVDARTVLILSRYEGLTYAEIGAIVGVRAGAARVRAHRALRALRERLTQRGVMLP
jgi:RNA polymerase sigma factor (sigma-70 family)